MSGITFSPRGPIVSGVGGGGAWIDNRQHAAPPAGEACAWSEQSLIYQSAIGTIRGALVDGSNDIELAPRPSSFLAADTKTALWASYLADGVTGVMASTGQHWPAAGLLAVHDGTIFLKTSYDAGGLSAWAGDTLVWEVPSAQPLPMPLPQFSALDRWRCCWTENGQLHAYGLTNPAQTEACYDPCLVELNGEIWLVSHGGPVVLRRWADASVGYILEPNGGYYTCAKAVDATHIQVAYSWGPASAGDVVTVTVDITAPMSPLTPTVKPPEPIVVIGRDIFAGWFTGADRSGLPGNSYLQAWQGADGFVRVNDGTIVAKFISASSDSDLAELNQRCADWDAHNTVPSLGYWTRKAQGIGVCTAKYVGVEAYCHAGEPFDAFEVEMRRQMARVPHPWLIAQCYTSNAGNTSDLEALVPVYARILRDIGDGVLSFSGTDAARGRATGYFDHPEVHEEWSELMAGIPYAPAVVVPPQPPIVVPPEPPITPIEPPVEPIDPGPIDPEPPEPPIIGPIEPPIIIPPTPIPVPPEPEPEEPDMAAIAIGQKGQFRPLGTTKAWTKGIVVHHAKDENMYEGKPVVFAISTDLGVDVNNPASQICAWVGGGKFENNRTEAGGAERAIFDGRNLLVGRPDDIADVMEWCNLA